MSTIFASPAAYSSRAAVDAPAIAEATPASEDPPVRWSWVGRPFSSNVTDRLLSAKAAVVKVTEEVGALPAIRSMTWADFSSVFASLGISGVSVLRHGALYVALASGFRSLHRDERTSNRHGRA